MLCFSLILLLQDRPDPIGSKRKAEDTQTGLKITKPKTDSSIGLAKDPHLLNPKIKAKEPALKQNPISTKTASKHSQQVESKLRHKFKFWCNICEVGAFCKTVMRSHVLGKKHIAAIKQKNETSKPASTSSFNIRASAAVTAPQSKAVMVVAGKKEKEKKVRLWCEVCKIRTYSEEVMEIHKVGKKHKALLEKL